jgi:hypothetical protein
MSRLLLQIIAGTLIVLIQAVSNLPTAELSSALDNKEVTYYTG